MLVCIDAGHGRYTPGKRCLKSIDQNETREWVLNSRIADKLQALLSQYDCQTIRVDDVTGETDVSLEERCERANSAGADVYVSIHHNAGITGGSGGGIVVYIHPSHQKQSEVVQEAVYRHLVEETGLKGNRSNPMAESSLYVLGKTRMPAVLCECGFMDSTTDTPVILTENFADQAARGLCGAMAEVYALKKIESPLLLRVSRPEDVVIELVDKPKKDCGGAYANAGYFASYTEKGEPFTLPVGHLVADYKAESEWCRKYCTERGKFDGEKYRFDSGSWAFMNPPYGKKVSTFLIRPCGAEIAEIEHLPADALYAVSGIPVLRDSKPVTMETVLGQGWDSSPLRATWHTLVGLKGDGLVYCMGWASKTSNLISSGEAAAVFVANGFTDVIKLDGGGSFIFQTGSEGEATAENRRINSIIRFRESETVPAPADPDYDRFRGYMERYLAERGGLPASSWAAGGIADAVDMGLTDGSRPGALATREEVMLMCKAAVEAAGKES